jgi:hypothetical protein
MVVARSPGRKPVHEIDTVAALTTARAAGTLRAMLRHDVSATLGASRVAVSRVVGVELILILPL